MDLLLYKIEPIGQSRKDHILDGTVQLTNRYGQVSETCWFYTAKMLLKFHGLCQNKNDQNRADFKALHELRGVLAELYSGAKVGSGNVTSVVGATANGISTATIEDKDVVRDRLEQKLGLLQDIKEGLGKYGKELTKTSSNYDSLEKLLLTCTYLTNNNANLSGLKSEVHLLKGNLEKLMSLEKYSTQVRQFNLNIPQKKLDIDPGKLQLRISSMEKAIKYIDDQVAQGSRPFARENLFEKFFDNGLFAKLSAKTFGPNEVRTLLKDHGPFYAGGQFLADAASVKKEKGYFTEADRDLQVIGKYLDVNHAILVCGNDDNFLYYKDPNNSYHYWRMKYEVFATNVSKDDAGAAKRVYAAACNKCVHLASQEKPVKPLPQS